MAFLNVEHDLCFFNFLKLILQVDLVLLLANDFGAPEAVVHASKHHLHNINKIEVAQKLLTRAVKAISQNFHLSSF